MIAKVHPAEQVAAGGLTIHADNGPAMKDGALLATLHRSGVDTSHSRPSVSSDSALVSQFFAPLQHLASHFRSPFESLNA